MLVALGQLGVGRPAQIGSPTPRTRRPAATLVARKSRQTGMMRAGLAPTSAMSASLTSRQPAEQRPQRSEPLPAGGDQHRLVALEPVPDEAADLVEELGQGRVQEGLVGELLDLVHRWGAGHRPTVRLNRPGRAGPRHPDPHLDRATTCP